MEVTVKGRENIEKSDAGWQRPPQWVIDMFNADPHGRYNEETGYGELNGLTDLSAQDMMDICYYGRLPISAGCLYDRHMYSKHPGLRTNLTPINAGNTSVLNANFLCAQQSRLEVFRIGETDRYGNECQLRTSGGSSFFSGCEKLHTIIGLILLSGHSEHIFGNCRKLRNFKLGMLTHNFDMRHVCSASIESMRYIVENARNSNPIIITVHPDVFSKLTDEGNEEWHRVMTDAADRDIQFVTV